MTEQKEWKFYFPDDGETAEDACPIIGKVWGADDAAQNACEYDFHSRDGCERGEREFPIVVISPAGHEFKFVGCHEPSVDHVVREVK